MLNECANEFACACWCDLAHAIQFSPAQFDFISVILLRVKCAKQEKRYGKNKQHIGKEN